MLYLILAIASSALVSISIRLSERYVKHNVGMLCMNYIICLILAVGYTGAGQGFQRGAGAGMAAVLGILNGMLFLASFLLLQFNVRKNGVVLSATFMKLGVLVPTLLSVLVFHEKPEVQQILGFGIALLAIVLINFEKGQGEAGFKLGLLLLLVGGGSGDAMAKIYDEIGSPRFEEAIVLINFEKGQGEAGFKLGLLLLLVGGGSGDAMAKIYDEIGSPRFEEQFLCVTFASALILCFALLCYKKQKITKTEVLFGVLVGIPNYFSARFLLKAVGEVPAVVAYPTYSVATIVVISLVGMLCFKEKITKRQQAAIGIILVALILLNV